ncbi:hypothetical protein AM500_12560 [Bacillus sp. FJAT-18017]|uniref:SEC-C metal-binding domain-containing protein n=1 Tax=Bacillus sp. FJAT-18017 TaxID=1705566 RepID=UPI0006AE4296|nr:SEC-C metal-binding domain-containing protein [Bacillus sp. FJAT-18017]ALC90525.1 hypothetical protein AM500_12560 [Bacillus sp. FJAT-18017]
MSSTISEKDSKQLMNAFAKMRELTAKTEQKREEKRWSAISVPFFTKDALSRLSKDDLVKIRQRLEISGVSQLKKGELIEVLVTEIPVSIGKLFEKLNEQRFRLLMKVVKGNGLLAAPKLTGRQLDYFQEYGILFTGSVEGKNMLAMPEEVVASPLWREKELEWRAIARRNTEWISLTHGLLFYYGSLGIYELVDLLEKYLDEPLKLRDYLPVIEEAISYYGQIRHDTNGYSTMRVFDSEKVLQEHGLRKDLEFYPFTKEQILSAGQPDFLDRNKGFADFVTFLTDNYLITKEGAESIVEECVYATQIGESPNDILQYLQRRVEFDNLETLKAFMVYIGNLMNNTRQWVLKGYTPIELSHRQQKVSHTVSDNNKIRRNDPCHCGSGKKYKKCCGR